LRALAWHPLGLRLGRPRQAPGKPPASWSSPRWMPPPSRSSPLAVKPWMAAERWTTTPAVGLTLDE